MHIYINDKMNYAFYKNQKKNLYILFYQNNFCFEKLKPRYLQILFISNNLFKNPKLNNF